MAPSICRRLLMQALACAVVRAFTKLGIAIAANKPMMATTIMISTRVKPLLRVALLFILSLSFLRREHGNRRVIIITIDVHELPVANRGSNLTGQVLLSRGNALFPYPFLTR